MCYSTTQEGAKKPLLNEDHQKGVRPSHMTYGQEKDLTRPPPSALHTGPALQHLEVQRRLHEGQSSINGGGAVTTVKQEEHEHHSSPPEPVDRGREEEVVHHTSTPVVGRSSPLPDREHDKVEEEADLHRASPPITIPVVTAHNSHESDRRHSGSETGSDVDHTPPHSPSKSQEPFTPVQSPHSARSLTPVPSPGGTTLGTGEKVDWQQAAKEHKSPVKGGSTVTHEKKIRDGNESD